MSISITIAFCIIGIVIIIGAIGLIYKTNPVLPITPRPPHTVPPPPPPPPPPHTVPPPPPPPAYSQLKMVVCKSDKDCAGVPGRPQCTDIGYTSLCGPTGAKAILPPPPPPPLPPSYVVNCSTDVDCASNAQDKKCIHRFMQPSICGTTGNNLDPVVFCNSDTDCLLNTTNHRCLNIGLFKSCHA